MTETESYIETLKELQEYLVEEEDLERALEVVEKLLSSPSDQLPPTLLPVLQETKLKFLLHLERFQDLLEIKDTVDDDSFKAYVYYRLQQYEKSKTLALATTSTNNSNESILAQHVLAQSLYRLHQPQQALQVYKNIPTEDGEDLVQVQTNALAVAAAHAIPYVATSVGELSVDDQFVDPSIHNSDYLYNLATLQVLTGNNNGRLLLQQAMHTSESEDAAVIVALQEWSLLWNDKQSTFTTTDNDDLPDSVATIRAVNHATSLKALSAIPCNSSWTALQQRLYYYKRAILQLCAKKYKDCKETISLLRKSLSQSKKNAPPPVSTQDEQVYWKTRLDVLEAHLLHQQQQDKRDEAVKLLQSTLQSLLQESSDSSSAMDYSIAYCMLHLHALEHDEQQASLQDTIDLLEGLPQSIQSSKAVTATLVSLYQQVGKDEKATALLSQQEGGMAEYYMSIGNYEEAAKLYEGVDGKEAEWVVALSHVDPDKAQQVWDSLNLDVEDNDLPEELNGEELEMMDLPRFKSRRSTTKTISSGTTDSTTKPKRSHDSILRQRARKRETYLQQHPEIREKKLDPERWLPKHERSYYRKRRGATARGAQGGGTNKDAAKLDVAARASGAIVDSGPSTAHVSVAASGKRSGRRR